MTICSGCVSHNQLRAPTVNEDQIVIKAPYPAKRRTLIPFREWIGLSNDDKTKLILRKNKLGSAEKMLPIAPSF